MATYEANIKLELERFDTEKEVQEAINAILADGLVAFQKNYADILNKPVRTKDVTLGVVIPPFGDVDKTMMAKILTQKLSVDDRQVGLHENRGINTGAYYFVNNVLMPTLEQFGMKSLFECYIRVGTGQILVQDILGEVIINFEEVPSMLLDLADFTMKLVDHYKVHQEVLEPLSTQG